MLTLSYNTEVMHGQVRKTILDLRPWVGVYLTIDLVRVLTASAFFFYFL